MAAAELWENSLAEHALRVYHIIVVVVGRCPYYVKLFLKQTYENCIFYKSTKRIII